MDRARESAGGGDLNPTIECEKVAGKHLSGPVAGSHVRYTPFGPYPRFRLHLNFDDVQPFQLRPITNPVVPLPSLADDGSTEVQPCECFVGALAS